MNSATFVLCLVSEFYFKTSPDHNCGNITKLPECRPVYLLTSLFSSNFRDCVLWRPITSQRCDEGCPNSKAPPIVGHKCTVLLLPYFIREEQDRMDPSQPTLSQYTLQVDREISFFVIISIDMFFLLLFLSGSNLNTVSSYGGSLNSLCYCLLGSFVNL